MVYGPVLMILFLSVLEVYETYYAQDAPPVPLFEGEALPTEEEA